MLKRSLAVTAAAVLLGAACGPAGPSQARTSEPSTNPSSTSPTPSARAATAITKVVVFVVENHSLSEMRTGMPRTYAFATKHAYATDYTAITHPSLPNYLAMVAGSTMGVTDDGSPSEHALAGRTVFTQALSHGRTAKVYADAMPSACYTSDSGAYAVRHNPWTYFADDRAHCRKYDVPVGTLGRDAAAGRMPNLSLVVPDVDHDAHDGTLAQADQWISSRIGTLTKGPDWQAGRLAIVVTADEDDHSAGNHVLTVVAWKGQAARVVRTSLNHYSLTAFLEDVLGVGHLRHARSAPSLTTAFAVPLP